MGSPRSEPERRPGEDQVEVTLTKGFWMAKYEATQGDWKRVMGPLPGPLTAELPEGDDFEGDEPVQTFLSRAINDALPAAAQFFEQFVIAVVAEGGRSG